MPTFSYDAENFPTHEEFIRQLREENETYDPVADLLALERELILLEQEHGIPSAKFYENFLAGQAPDTVAAVAWSAKYRLYLNLKEAISASLLRIVTDSSS